jgi:hypothetical protein
MMVDEGWFVMPCDTELQDSNTAKVQLEDEYPKLGITLPVVCSCN